MLGDDITELGIGPVDNLADTIASGEIELDLAETQDTDKLQELVELAENGELGEIDAELEAQIEVIRSILGEKSK
ncbi:MAG: hypothetical protein A07HR60_02565 [uncultured archaeon A07HR60]|nr:MAG: hypothetical protein A07HR60_02565 [uncultured archaeon A07HR60]